jgi:thiol:disulfide interchange protein DsbD
MKQFLGVAILFILFNSKVSGQILNPVHWSYGVKKINKTEAFLYLKADIDKGWHIYSQSVKDGGPAHTSFVFTKSTSYSIVGRVTEPAPIIKYEAVFKMNVGYFEGSTLFQQKIKLNKANSTVSGVLTYQACNDRHCIPPTDVNFSVSL